MDLSQFPILSRDDSDFDLEEADYDNTERLGKGFGARDYSSSRLQESKPELVRIPKECSPKNYRDTSFQ